MDDGTIEKWCGECGAWGDHLRADHPGARVGAEAGNLAGLVNDDDELGDANLEGGVLARLRAAGLV